jgi:hypothetical protein
MTAHDVQWMAPAPFWVVSSTTEEAPTQQGLARPAILRFASDDFMAHFMAVLERSPKKLAGLTAQWETWREAPAASPSHALLAPTKPQSAVAKKLERIRIAKAESIIARSGEIAAAAKKPSESPEPHRLKLFQPAHQRFYLVVASLVCEIVGFPDRAVDTGKQERVSFVVRRLVPRNTETPIDKLDIEASDEYAFVIGLDGPRWVKAEAALVAGEEQLPFFPTQFADDQGHRRRVWSALIPVGKRETYLGTRIDRPADQSGDSGGGITTETGVKIEDPRMTLVRGEFLEPWKRSHEKANAVTAMLADPSNKDQIPIKERDAALKAAREQIQTLSLYALLDFAKFLKSHIPNVWDAIEAGTSVPGMTTEESALFTAIQSVNIGPTLAAAFVPYQSQVKRSLTDALKAIMGSEGGKLIADKLENAVTSYTLESPDWPTMLFPLADPQVLDEPLPVTSLSPEPGEDNLTYRLRKIDRFGETVGAALPPMPTAKMPAVRAAAQAVTTAKDGWFVVRCLFQREACGPLHPVIVSDPTVPFQMASFFDPDAPARPIRIPLPLDTTPAGLRKFDKNTAFLVSDVLCGQMTRLKSLGLIDLIRAVLPWPLHKDLDVPDKGPCKDGDGLDIGMLCSISIPIVTICAMVLLMVIVSLLDLIFRWIPYFILCFPLPKLKGKST